MEQRDIERREGGHETRRVEGHVLLIQWFDRGASSPKHPEEVEAALKQALGQEGVNLEVFGCYRCPGGRTGDAYTYELYVVADKPCTWSPDAVERALMRVFPSNLTRQEEVYQERVGFEWQGFGIRDLKGSVEHIHFRTSLSVVADGGRLQVRDDLDESPLQYYCGSAFHVAKSIHRTMSVVFSVVDVLERNITLRLTSSTASIA